LSTNEIAHPLSAAKQAISAQKINATKKLDVKKDIELLKCAVLLDLIDGPCLACSTTE